MEKIGFEELSSWCTACGYSLEHWMPSLVANGEHLNIRPPGEPRALADCVDDLVNIEGKETERIIWIRDWTIWDQRYQDVGLAHLHLLVDSLPVQEQQKPGHVYRLKSCEWTKAVALLTVPLLYGWDAHLFFRSGAALVDVSHEDRISVSLRSGGIADVRRLQAWQNAPA